MLDILYKKFENFCNILDSISGVLLAFLTCIILVEVVGRYFFNHPFTLTYDLALLIFPYIVMASMVSITFHNEQLGIDFFKNKMTGNVKKIALIIIDFFTLFFIFSMFLSSAKLSKTVWYSKVGTWRMPQPFLYFPMVFSYALSFLMVLISKLKNTNKLNQKKRKE